MDIVIYSLQTFLIIFLGLNIAGAKGLCIFHLVAKLASGKE